MKKIIGAGSLIVDITGYADRLPVAGETALGKTLRFGPGGKGNNQMTAAHRAGAEAVVIGRVGSDWLRTLMLRHYRDAGMSTRYVKVSEKSETGSALIEVDAASGQNRIIVVKGACDEISAEDVREAEADFASCDLVLTQLETSLESVLECKRLAEKYDKPLLLNPAPFQKVPKSLFAGVDYLAPNETEAEFFTGIPVRNEAGAVKAAEKFLALGVKHVVITLGKNGVFYSDGTTRFSLPMVPAKTVDTTGAGDTYTGYFLAEILKSGDTARAMRLAACAAALEVTRPGAAKAIPAMAEVAAFMERFGR